MICPRCKEDVYENASCCHACGAKINIEKTGNHSARNIYIAVMLALYGIALVTCFICNLAVSHTLSWFFIVLASIMLSFSITNLPLLLRKHRSIISALIATVLIYLLLFVCCLYVQGNWLFSVAYPIATFSVAFAWLIFITVKYSKVNWGYKISVILLLSGIFTITANPLIGLLTGEDYKFVDSFVYHGGAVNYSGNGITFLSLVACAVISAVIGLILSFRARRSK